jgi:aryl-alcohol dehydrogenase-like predicted oxidoreductase
METAKLGTSDISMSRIGLGCEPLGGTDWGAVDEDLAQRAIAEGVACGIDLFDTADIYGLGRSEERLAHALAAHRHRAVIISKCGIRPETDFQLTRARTYRDGSARWVAEAVDQSLRRLRIERIPLYLVHWPDPNTPITETIAALDHCRRAGKVGHIGVSNFSATQLREAHQASPLTVVELQYNLLTRYAERDVLPLCEQLGIGVIAYGPLAQGLLTGKYAAGHRFGVNDRRHRLPHFQDKFLIDSLETMRRLKEVSRFRRRSPAQVALRWVLDHPVVSGAIVGVKSPEQVRDNVQALGWNLNPEERSYLGGEQRSL